MVATKLGKESSPLNGKNYVLFSLAHISKSNHLGKWDCFMHHSGVPKFLSRNLF